MKDLGVGVADGARTHDNRNHNPRQLSSIHAGLRPVHGKLLQKLDGVGNGFAGVASHGSWASSSPLPHPLNLPSHRSPHRLGRRIRNPLIFGLAHLLDPSNHRLHVHPNALIRVLHVPLIQQ